MHFYLLILVTLFLNRSKSILNIINENLMKRKCVSNSAFEIMQINIKKAR